MHKHFCKSHLCPHLLDILKNHVAVPVKCLYSAKELSIVSAVDEDLQAPNSFQTSFMACALDALVSYQGDLQQSARIRLIRTRLA